MKEEFYYVWIRFFRSIGFNELNKIYKKLNITTLKELYDYPEINNYTKRFLDEEIKEKAKKMYNRILKENIKIITINDYNYPKKLRKIYSPPLVLFIKGNYKILNKKMIGMVGSRECTDYGKKTAYKFAEKLAKKYIIISGLARGIDSYSHKGAIYNYKESTVAVIGTGLNICYPRENIYLEEKILENGGCIVTEFLLDEEPNRWNFPMRNRIVAGMCDKLVVIEARKKSGALITVDMALENGKEVYAVPGNINSKYSIGTNELIKEGCIVLNKIDSLM